MVVFFDVDGTIIDEHTQQIPLSAIRAVEQLGKNGHLAVVNTGRPYSHVESRIRDMAFCGWVCGCGMELILDGRKLSAHHPDTELCRYVRDLVRKCRMQVLYETDDSTLLTDGELSAWHPTVLLEIRRFLEKGFRVCDIDSLPQPRFMKGVTWDGPDSLHEEFLRGMEPYFTCIDRGNTMVEFVLKGCSKAAGMEEFLKLVNVSPADSMAIGDSTNDLPMFRVAGHAVCMGGSMPEVEREAEYITASVLDDGIEKALRHYGLI